MDWPVFTGVARLSLPTPWRWGLVCLILSVLPSPRLPAADYLPNAAAHIGTIVINQDAQFTTNAAVALTLSAVNDGTGVVQMQFSNDELSWSAPEPYQTSKQWGLATPVYPPTMSTVLETVYVRFQDGTGQWSPPVSDSIIFARSSLDIPQVQEVWIAQQTPTNYDGTQPPGSQPNPFLIPASSNEPQFDSLMHSLMMGAMTNQSYVAEGANASAFPGPATNMTVLTVHIGAGLYETHGACRSLGDNLAWSPWHGWRIIGAGKDATMFRAVDIQAGITNQVEIIGGYFGNVASYDNLEISDLTLDANLHEGETNYQGRYTGCIFLQGNNLQIHRVRVKNFGTTIPGFESGGGICFQNPGNPRGDYNAIIEDCEVVQAQVGNAYKSGVLGVLGSYASDGTIRYFYNLVVRNCYVDGAAYDGDTPVDPMSYAYDDRGRFGIGISGCLGAVAEDNLVQNVPDGFYLDSMGLHDITLRNNHFRNVFDGFNIAIGTWATGTNRLTGTFRFDNNLVELDPRFFPAGDINGSYGWRWGFKTWANLFGGDYIYNNFAINSNVFQFTDQSLPQTNVFGATMGGLVSFRTAEVTSNIFIGLQMPIGWNNGPEFFDQQVDIVDNTRTVPLICQNNTREDGTIVEAYPYVLDSTLPRPVVAAGSSVNFPAPTVEGAPAVMVTGAPPTATLTQNGNFQWQTGFQDAGKYVIGFHKDTNRLSDARYTLITVLPFAPDSDPHYFSDGLVGYWKLNETSGETFQDSSGNGITIDHSGDAGLISLGGSGNAPGKKAAQFINNPVLQGWLFPISNTNQQLFTGLASNYFCPLAKTTSLYHPFTLSFWFMMPSKPQQSQMILMDDSGFFLGVDPGANTGNNLVALEFFDGVSSIASMTTPETVTVGAWHHVAVVYDGISERLYVDAVKLAEKSGGQMAGCSASSFVRAGGGYGWQNFGGSIGELAIWNRPLSDGEIARVRADQSGPNDPVPVPLSPSELTVQLGSSGSVYLSWQDNSLNESGFVLQRSTNNSDYTTIADLGQNSTAFVDSLPDTNGTYFYRITAVNSLGSSDYSTVAILGPCTYVLDSISTNVGAAATSGTFGVNGTVGCPWTAQVCASCDWIQTSSSGVCPGVVSFSVSSNLTTASRSGTITVQGLVFTITQTRMVQTSNSTYSALLIAPTNPAPAQAGLVTLTTTAKRAFTGTLQLGAKSYPLRGKVDIGGQARVTVKRPKLPSLSVALQIGPDDADLLSGSVSDGTWSAGFSGARGVYDGRSSLAPQQGRYTMIIEGQPASATQPGGDSFATVTVDKAGRVRLAGTLADGTSISRSGLVTKGGGWALYVPLYAGQGGLVGGLNFTNTGSNDLAGGVTWTKLAMSRAKYYPAGFFVQTSASGAAYTRPPAGTAVLAFSSGLVVLSGGDLTQALSSQITIGGNNRVTEVGGGNQLNLSISPSTGLFRGAALDPATGKKLSLSGVVLQKSSFGSGFFKGPDRIGHTYVGP
jgi:hypothetical protein